MVPIVKLTHFDGENVPYLKPHNDDSYVDELRIITRERYKTSGMSGDEWRFHRVLQCFRKGVMLFERAFNGDVPTVASFAPLAIAEQLDNGLPMVGAFDDFCCQPGCANPATSEYEIIEQFGERGDRLHPEEQRTKWHRRFCQKHLRRGDCAREDCDANYRVVSGYGAEQADMEGANIVESARVDVRVDSLDQLGAAIQKAKQDHENRA